MDERNHDTPVLSFNSPEIPILKIYTRHVQTILQNLSIDKAPGLDEIPPMVLKNCSTVLAPVYQNLILPSQLERGKYPANSKKRVKHEIHYATDQ